MIRKLKWDSAIFGYTVGRIFINYKTQTSMDALLKEAANFKLVYIVSPYKIHSPPGGAKLVDIKIKLVKQVIEYEDDSAMPLGEYDGCGDIGQLKMLAIESGIYSRFNKDPCFINNEFEKLYIKWITSNIRKTTGQSLIVYKDAGNNYKGFITLNYKENFAEIGLIAVEAAYRGKGVGLALLQYANNLTRIRGLNKIKVSTQLVNIPAMELYKKAGYKITAEKYIYHLWN